MFESVLVANRGEIAVRIFRTCQRLGVRGFAVFSDADARALHVQQADAAYRLGPAPASESYLNVEAVLDAARASGAQAVHPGYGFLAENPDFAQACLDAGLAWIGPPPAAMRALGDKAHAKALAEQHGVPLLPGYHGDDQRPEVLRDFAAGIGFPVLIKASAGGGGRGMRIVRSLSDFLDALEAARREARGAFGDDRVLLERYVERPRHIEVQILGDQHGHLVHLGERECSIQRRHQKLVEESPSPVVSAELRASLGDAALRLARAAGYTNAGTVEFLLDERGQPSFLEVNARLQVEHPVTEAVTGLDLVELQLRVAAGEPLPLTQDDIVLNGHAIEVRLIAEDPLAGWLPSSGTLSAFAIGPGVRVDTGFAAGSVVPAEYDSLLAKVIAFGEDRATAIDALRHALRTTIVEGLHTNVDALLATIEHPDFRAAHLHTGFLDEHGIVDGLAELPAPVLAAASALEFERSEPAGDPWRGARAWRLGRVDQPVAWLYAGRRHDARVSASLDGQTATVDTPAGDTQVRSLSGHRASVDGHVVSVDDLFVEYAGRSYRLQPAPALSIDDTASDRGNNAGAGRLTAPMPGRVVKISVQRGDAVHATQTLVVLEAMKMEHLVAAPHAGIVQQVCVEVGQQVTAGTVLLEVGDEPLE